MSSNFTEGFHYQDNLLPKYQRLAGHEVTIITTVRMWGKEGSIVLTEPGEKMLEDGIRLIRLPLPGRIGRFFGIYPCIRKLIEREKPDFIFLHGLAAMVTGDAVAYCSRHPGVTMAADNHQDDFNTAYNKPHIRFQMFFFRMMWKRWIKSVSRVYGTTSWRAEFARRVYGIPEEKTDVLFTGCTEKFNIEKCMETRHEVRRELGVPDDAFVFIHGGKLNSAKRTMEVMEAFSEIKAAGAKLVLFGSTGADIAEDFGRLLEGNPEIINLRMLPGGKVSRYLLSADFGLFPGGHSTLWEEAIGSGLPCLFRNYGEEMHLNCNGNAVIVDNPGRNELMDCMNKVLNDREFYRTLLARTRELAPEFYYGSIAVKSLETADRGR